MMGIKKRVFAVVLSAIMLLSVAGVGVASAKYVDGGNWIYSSTLNDYGFTTVVSRYYHKTERHGSSVKIGRSGSVLRRCASKGLWSYAGKWGIGYGYAYCHICSQHNH